MGTASEIVIWMVLAALVGFATGWALRSVVANRARARLSERLEEKRREAQELREELRHLRGDDEDVVHVPPCPEPRRPGTTTTRRSSEDGAHEEPTLGADGRARRGRARAARRARADGERGGTGGSTRAMRLDEVEWEDVEDPPRRRDDEA